MADCGATGSALDRTAAALAAGAMGGGTSSSSSAAAAATKHAAKAMASFVGGTAVTSSGAVSVMPQSIPDHLTLGPAPFHPEQQQQQQQQHQQQQHMAKSYQQQSMNPMQQRHHPPPPPSVMMAGMPPPSQMMIMAQQQQKMHMQFQMQQQQQQQQQMAQMQAAQLMQMRALQQSQQQKSHVQKQPQQRIVTDKGATNGIDFSTNDADNNEEEEEDVYSTWHEDLNETELAAQFETLQQQQQQTNNTTTDATGDMEEIPTTGASMEQLIEAWTQAQEAHDEENLAEAYQYGNDFYDDTDPNNETTTMAPYEFSEQSLTYMQQQQHSNTTTTTSLNTTDTTNNTVDFMTEGMKQFHAGNLTSAILNFESELRQINMDNAEAWRMLGRCHAENDEDRRAIACLERAVEQDPYNPKSLLALGVSYVNELDHVRALRNLKQWITHNPDYAGMDLTTQGENESTKTTTSSSPPLDEVKELLQRAMEHNPDSSDALEAYGVVCNVSREYDLAIDSFRRAIALSNTNTTNTDDNYQLWNKLGATLANHGKSEEALPSYHRALELKPKYARAWLNMAISHSNLKNYTEACRCYLQTLSLNPSAIHVWSYLRIALTCNEQWDLLHLVVERNIDGFKSHFDFIHYID